MSDAIFASLTTAQQTAVRHIDGPLLILAGPGSGKTRVITHRIAHMIQQGIHPSSILALTFTNKAADEMKQRVQRLEPDASVWIGTFHRFCSQLLRRYAAHVGLASNFTIYDTSDSRQALKRALTTISVPLRMTTPERVSSQISWLKNQLIRAEDFQPRPGHEMSAILEEAYPAYQRELLAANAVDFDDLLLHVVTLLEQSPELRAALDERYRYVMVDEYQDTNLPQYAIARALSNEYPNLAVTGDPDQSIYGWRGANLNNILDFEADYPQVHVVRLEQNYRSTPNILRVAQALIANNLRRKHKELFTQNPEGVPVRLATYATQKDEAEGIIGQIAQQLRDSGRRPSEFAIFYRINALSRAFEHALREERIPYQIVHGVEFYQRKEVKDVLAYLQLIHNPRDNVALLRIINVPPRRLGASTLTSLSDSAREQGLTLLEVARDCAQSEAIPKAARPRLQDFARLIDRLRAQADNSIETLLRSVLDETGYLAALRESSTPEDEERAANVEELLTAASEFDQRESYEEPLASFLEQASLINDVDGWDDQTERVTLMTLHAAKGLEFPVVFIIGVEQGLLPHERSMHDRDQHEEERRLLFVGITRAKEQLQLSRAYERAHRGGISLTIPSNFLLELPRQEMELIDLGRRSMAPSDAPLSLPFPASPPPRRSSLPQLQTAAQLFDTSADPTPAGNAADDAGPLDPASFQVGMTVVHPEYGPGKIAALSGQGKQRTGTVNFVTAGQKKFVLAKSKVRPAK